MVSLQIHESLFTQDLCSWFTLGQLRSDARTIVRKNLIVTDWNVIFYDSKCTPLINQGVWNPCSKIHLENTSWTSLYIQKVKTRTDIKLKSWCSDQTLKGHATVSSDGHRLTVTCVSVQILWGDDQGENTQSWSCNC